MSKEGACGGTLVPRSQVLRKIEKYRRIIYVYIIQETTTMYRIMGGHQKGFVHGVRTAVKNQYNSDNDTEPGQLNPYYKHALASTNYLYIYNNKIQQNYCDNRKLFQELPLFV